GSRIAATGEDLHRRLEERGFLFLPALLRRASAVVFAGTLRPARDFDLGCLARNHQNDYVSLPCFPATSKEEANGRVQCEGRSRPGLRRNCRGSPSSTARGRVRALANASTPFAARRETCARSSLPVAPSNRCARSRCRAFL